MNTAAIILIPLLGSLLPALARNKRALTPWLAGGVAGIALVFLLTQAQVVFLGQPILTGWQWLPELGLNLTFRLDGLGLLFALLILIIGLLVILYASYYLSADDPMPRFYAFLLLFMSAMLGIVLSENLLLMMVFWELTSLSSFFLIGYWKHRSDARQGARMALTITGAGGLALLGGVLLIGHIVGSFELSTVLASGEQIKNHPLYPTALVLILLGAFTKSAQFPFHFWLPHAMAAPTPVSAYLHSATMVKAGLFLLARFYPALAGTDLWFFLVSGAGLTTLLLAAYLALLQHDLKGLLAYSTLSHLGLITLLFGLGTPLGEVAGVFHIINHAIFKASLFMAAGIIDHETGSRDMRRLNGLFKYMPRTAILAMVAAASMAGVPLFNGFLSKEMFFGEAVHYAMLGGGYWLMPVAVTIAGVFSVAYSLRFVHDVFFNGEPVGLPRQPHEPPRWMRIPVEVLVVLCLLVGIMPALTVGPLLNVAVASILGPEPLPEYSLSIWHGVNLALIMSIIALGVGVLVYSARRFIFHLHESATAPLPLADGKHYFDALLTRLLIAADWLTSKLENGSLQRYLALLIGSAVVAVIWPLLVVDSFASTRPLGLIDFVTLSGAFLMSLAALAAVFLHRQRLTALILVSVVGLFVALAFVRFSAPDLALTQLSVEVVTIVLLLLALYYLPQQSPRESTGRQRWRDLWLAGLAGLATASLTWGVLIRPYDSISGYFLENSKPGGGGTNAVNVILVDFRGFDTLGEITVLGVAALGIVALLSGLKLPTRPLDPGGRAWSSDRFPLILRVISRPALPLMLLVAVYIFLRGHNLPGGGFIAGLVAALALVLQYLANGIVWARKRMDFRLGAVIGLGLLCATLTGLASWLFGYPFLTSTFTYVEWPWVGKFEVASALAFDTGVFLTVVGIVLLILRSLGQLSQAHASVSPKPAGTAPDKEPHVWKV